MKTVQAANLIRRLRGAGVRVYLDPQERVTFSTLEGVPASVKHEIMACGAAMKQKLKDEAALRAVRVSLKK